MALKRLPALALVVVSGCAHSWTEQSDRRTCLVLSSGGPAGMAHIGAIQAMQARHVSIDCVSGTSIGALIGGLYASAPKTPLQPRYQELIAAYQRESHWEFGRNAMIGSAVGALVAAIVTGGAATLPLALGASAGAAAALKATPPVALARFEAVLTAFHQGQQIEQLPIPYVTFYQQRSALGLKLVTANTGPLADAVIRSVANPFIFPDFDPVAAGYVDPGADRMAAVPVEDTCKLFPKARLLAVNVTGHPIVYSNAMTCPLLQVDVNVDPVSEAAMTADNAEFERVVRAGHQAVLQALDADAVR